MIAKDIRMPVLLELRKIVATLALLGSAISAQAQSEVIPSEPLVSSEVLTFQCKRSFTDKGIGLCAGRIDMSVKNLAHPARAAEFRCEVVVRYWWQDGRDKRWEMKSLQISAPAERLGMHFAHAPLLFEIDVTSVIKEPQEANIAKTRCEAEWRY